MTVESNEGVSPPMDIDEMRQISKRLVAWRNRFDELLELQEVAPISRRAGVSEARLWRYKRKEILWLSIAEYLKLFAVITLTAVPEIMDDPVKAAEHRPRKFGPSEKPQRAPKPPPEPKPFENVSLE